jgi:nuclear factor I, invertebrate
LRYATHPATRLISVDQSRQDEVLLHQQQQQSALVQQAVSPEGTVFYQHSPSASEVHASDNHHSPDGDEIVTVSSRKYSECQANGHDTLSDFVTFVCQETEQSGTNQNHRDSPKSQQYSNYNTLPPMLPPLAIPVAIRSSDLNLVNSKGADYCSPPASITPPNSSPHQKHQESHMRHSPPLSPQSQMDRKGLTRISSPYSNGRDYTFNHFHTPQPQVRF